MSEILTEQRLRRCLLEARNIEVPYMQRTEAASTVYDSHETLRKEIERRQRAEQSVIRLIKEQDTKLADKEREIEGLQSEADRLQQLVDKKSRVLRLNDTLMANMTKKLAEQLAVIKRIETINNNPKLSNFARSYDIKAVLATLGTGEQKEVK